MENNDYKLQFSAGKLIFFIVSMFGLTLISLFISSIITAMILPILYFVANVIISEISSTYYLFVYINYAAILITVMIIPWVFYVKNCRRFIIAIRLGFSGDLKFDSDGRMYVWRIDNDRKGEYDND